MAKLVSKNQRLVTGVMNPGSSYSRTVTCIAYIKGTPDARGFTPPLGQVVRLLGVDIWTTPDYSAVAGAAFSFRILYGTGEPPTAAAILEWENIIPVYWPDGTPREWHQHQMNEHMHWSMDRLFKGQGQRFGVWLEVSGVIPILEFFASFQISEG